MSTMRAGDRNRLLVAWRRLAEVRRVREVQLARGERQADDGVDRASGSATTVAAAVVDVARPPSASLDAFFVAFAAAFVFFVGDFALLGRSSSSSFFLFLRTPPSSSTSSSSCFVFLVRRFSSSAFFFSSSFFFFSSAFSSSVVCLLLLLRRSFFASLVLVLVVLLRKPLFSACLVVVFFVAVFFFSAAASSSSSPPPPWLDSSSSIAPISSSLMSRCAWPSRRGPSALVCDRVADDLAGRARAQLELDDVLVAALLDLAGDDAVDLELLRDLLDVLLGDLAASSSSAVVVPLVDGDDRVALLDQLDDVRRGTSRPWDRRSRARRRACDRRRARARPSRTQQRRATTSQLTCRNARFRTRHCQLPWHRPAWPTTRSAVPDTPRNSSAKSDGLVECLTASS